VLGGKEGEGETLVNHILDMPVQTVQEQVLMLGSISNYHWWASLDMIGHVKSSSNQPKYHQHLLLFPGQRKVLPASPRNMLMYYAPQLKGPMVPDLQYCSDPQRRFMFNTMHLVKYDQEIEVDILHSKKPVSDPPIEPPQTTNDDQEMGPPQKKRRYAYREVSANPEDLLEGPENASRGGSVTVNSSVPQRNMFTSFSEELHSKDGIVQWRKHLEDEDAVVLNDYSPNSGKLKPLDYVHVTATATDSGQVQIKCTCRIYQYMHGKALRKANMEDGYDTVLGPNFTCMHCRFYSTFLQPFQAHFNDQQCLNKLHEKVRQTEIEVNAPIVLLGDANPSTTTKLSVLAEDSLAVVHIHFNPSDCFAKCQDGMCQTLHSTKRRVPAGISLRDLPKGGMCDHLHTLFHNQDVLDDLFPEYFKQNNPTFGEVSDGIPVEVPDPEPVNNEDSGIMLQVLSDNLAFNHNEGIWQCKAHSHYQPHLERHHPDLVSNTHSRLMYSVGPVNHKGLHTGPVLTPDMSVDEGEPEKTCPWAQCGAKYTNMVERKVIVYTRQVIEIYLWLS